MNVDLIERALRYCGDPDRNCGTSCPLSKQWFEYGDCEGKLMLDAADLIESMQRSEIAAIKILQTIEWVGSGAKGRISDSIRILLGALGGPQEGATDEV